MLKKHDSADSPPGSSLDPGPGRKGVLAGPGTPRDQKSHLFVTNWVAIQPFFKPKAGLYAEFRRGSRQIGLTPSISTFFDHFWTPKNGKMLFLVTYFAPARNEQLDQQGLAKTPPWGPWGDPGGPWAGRPEFPFFFIFFLVPKMS